MCNWFDSMKGLHTGNSFDFFLAFHSSCHFFPGPGYHLKSSDSFWSLSCAQMVSFSDLKESSPCISKLYFDTQSKGSVAFPLRPDCWLNSEPGECKEEYGLYFYSSCLIFSSLSDLLWLGERG